jgi:polysaccharide export outer membrane protein
MALATLGLAGCGGTLSGAGPYKGDIESKNQPYNLVEINANTIGPYARFNRASLSQSLPLRD